MTHRTDDHTDIGGLAVARPLVEFVRDRATPGTGVSADDFWAGLEALLREIDPENLALLEERDRMQLRIDEWHRDRPAGDRGAYVEFLRELGYLLPEPEGVTVAVESVDGAATVPAPQLVVPADNARYALNAANARWGSLYDALYGTDVIDESGGAEVGGGYNPVRGRKVIDFGRALLDEHFPLASGSHADATGYRIADGALWVELPSGRVGLAEPSQFVAFGGPAGQPTDIMLELNGLHMNIRIDPENPVGAGDPASVADIVVESAATTIVDLEDSVAAVDAEDKVVGYGNWLGLMRGDLTDEFEKNGEVVERRLEPDIELLDPTGAPVVFDRCSLLLVRNVGMHLRTPMVLLDGQPVAETIVDAAVTSLCALHDLRNIRVDGRNNSSAGSVYIVKPKMHGPAEVALASRLFARVEDLLGLTRNTLKMGIMDEERRTSVNLVACIEAARERVVFINTGFLDRTGDEIHTSMEAGPMVPKGEMKSSAWLAVYEDSNVDVGLATRLNATGQIGKGMWAQPDNMAAMLEAKIGHPLSGASCAWVPSPTAATLHALHYFRVDVRARQAELASRPRAEATGMLDIPLMEPHRELTDDQVVFELENNCQGILGYVARWVGQGVGCSKVPDLNDVGLMEDRATLRISSQHIANWLHHDVVSEQQVRDTMARMAAVVDQQNGGDPAYEPMSSDLETSIPYQAALALVLDGRAQPNGYTEFILTDRRRAQKG